MNGKKIGIIAILGIIALCAIGYFIYDKKQNAVGTRAIPISVSGVEAEVVERWVNVFQTVLKNDEVLERIISDSDYAAKLEIPEEEALESLRNAVRISHSTSRRAITIGLSGKKKYSEELNTISQQIFNVSGQIVASRDPAFGSHFKKLQETRQ